MPSISGKAGKTLRRKSALKLLEKQYADFRAAGIDKQTWETTRNGGKRHITHAGKTFDQECARMSKEIDILKQKLLLSLKLTFFKKNFFHM